MEHPKIFASCHNHSDFSDADMSPEELVALAHSLGHGGIILTDHDTVQGTYFINKAARKLGKPLAEKVAGVDFGFECAGRAAAEGKSLFLLGGKDGIAEAAA